MVFPWFPVVAVAVAMELVAVGAGGDDAVRDPRSHGGGAGVCI